MNQKENTAKQAVKKTETMPRVNITPKLIAKGAELLTKLDETLTKMADDITKVKGKEKRLGQDLVTYIAKFGNNLKYVEILLIKNTLYDSLLWKRQGAKMKGRATVNPTINKYFSLIFSFVKSTKDGGSGENLTTETQFADIRSAYSEVGLKLPIKNANYEISKVVREFFNKDKMTKTRVKEIQKSVTRVLKNLDICIGYLNTNPRKKH